MEKEREVEDLRFRVHELEAQLRGRQASGEPKAALAGDALFEHCLGVVFGHEGGWSDHANDRGGATKMGVTIKTLIEWRALNDRPVPSREDLEVMTVGEAVEIYRTLYWRRARCSSMPAAVALVVFDGAVNHGVGSMVRLLQTAVRGMGVNPGPIDGAAGKLTLNALATVSARKLALELIARRCAIYQRLCARDPKQVDFALGWARRLVALQVDVERLVAAPRPS